MNENEINVTTTCILALANQPNAEEKIKLLLANLFASYPQKDTFNTEESKNSTLSSVIQFTQKEIEKMATTFKKQFIANGLVAHVLKKPCGKSTFSYEIRYRANGFDIRTSSTDLQKAKAKFLEKTTPKEIEKYRVKNNKCRKDFFQDIFNEWCETKKGTITEKAVKTYQSNFSNLPESLRKTPINMIRTNDLSNIMKDSTPRKYEDLRTLFNGIFKYAIASGIINHNPVAIIPFKRAERENHECFSSEEIMHFFEVITDEKYYRIKQASYILYFFGLRPCEIDNELKREGNFLIARNRKRKNGKIEYKKIPIPKKADSFIDWSQPLTFGVTPKIYYEWYREIFGDKTPYSFRHTFCTICQQYVRQEIVDIWMGDSPQRLIGKVYTHFSDDFMSTQMDLVNFPTKTS